MKKQSGYQKLKAELKDKDQIIESLKRELNAKDQTIEFKNETIGALKRETDTKDQLIKSLIEEGHRDEEKEYSKSCLGLE
ncbi:hypothetical protein JT102_07420 [Helicobacter pylori]|nr:hypothetical protein [Helicobacter pylori]